ncbi:calcium-binding protein [Sphingomonas sp.]|uniref:calcium-binding protein n=1 Tax=Sphingomonas sp. TaxID=28214 RepID=UPI003B3AF892
MATYTFETMADSSAVGFGAGDRLIFNTATVNTLSVTDNPATTGPLGTTVETITLASGNVEHTFVASALAGASAADNLIFTTGEPGDALAIVSGDQGAGGYAQLAGAVAGSHVSIFGIGDGATLDGTAGDDTITGSAGNDTITGSSSSVNGAGDFTETDYLQGGNGADTITGGDGNDHIYGNLALGSAGKDDGADVLSGGAGNDYINGNAGDDSIDGGADNDRLYGGAGNDSILGGDGNDYLQGNKGDDSLDGGLGNDELHGGQGNDGLLGNDGNDVIFGDLGDDSIAGGAGYDTLTGGAGADTFFFQAGDASTEAVVDGGTVTDQILDFNAADGDTLNLGFEVAEVLTDKTGTTYTNVAQALQGAEGIFLTAGSPTDDVVSVQVGADTYLFWSNGGTIDEVVHLANTTAANVDTDWFSQLVA